MNINQESLLKLCNIAIDAGLIINKHYNADIKVSYKYDKSPLTTADLESNNYIIKSILNLYPEIPILSEESLVDWNIRKNWETYWLIDPLDGTKEFINKNNEFTVNISLIKNNLPYLGIIYAPALGRLYYSKKNEGSYKINSFKRIYSLSKSSSLKVSTKKPSDQINIVQSRSHSNEKLVSWIKKNIQNYKILKKGSSLKFCDIAEGKADFYPRFGPTSEWDIAAGHMILLEAGGELKTIDDKKILYNLKEDIKNPDFIATCKLIV